MTSTNRSRRDRHGLRPVRAHETRCRPVPAVSAHVSPRQSAPRPRRGAALVNVAVALLFALAAGLYAVSLRAQFDYVLAVKHEPVISWIEAVALDAGMVIFTLLALGLARAGQPARIERLAIVACALGSAAMNLAAADSASVRSVLAYVIPPVFLALVVDRTVAVVRRHFLGESDASAWSQLGRICLYLIRFFLAPPSTARGVRQRILDAAPVPQPGPGPQAAALTADAQHDPRREPIPAATQKAIAPGGRESTKTARFLALVIERHGPLADLPIDQVSPVCTALAPEVGLDAGAARTALRRHVLAARDGGKPS
ncbi:MAG: hypothetical protein ACLP52_27830 [Streptosporangiaceae bacterium]